MAPGPVSNHAELRTSEAGFCLCKSHSGHCSQSAVRDSGGGLYFRRTVSDLAASAERTLQHIEAACACQAAVGSSVGQQFHVSTSSPTERSLSVWKMSLSFRHSPDKGACFGFHLRASEAWGGRWWRAGEPRTSQGGCVPLGQ